MLTQKMIVPNRTSDLPAHHTNRSLKSREFVPMHRTMQVTASYATSSLSAHGCSAAGFCTAYQSKL